MTRVLQPHDDYWTHDVVLSEAIFSAFRGKPRQVRALIHESPERYQFLKPEERQIVPVAALQGERIYVQAQFSVAVPDLYLTVGLSGQPGLDGAVGAVIGAEQRGRRREEIGKAQAWYYPADRLLLLFECFFIPRFRDAPLLEDANLPALWMGMEGWLIGRFPEAERLATPFRDLEYDTESYQAFLRRMGYAPVAKAAFGKAVHAGRRRPQPGSAPALYSLCLRCGLEIGGEYCPRCDASDPQRSVSAPAPDHRAREAWQELRDQGLPVPSQPWTRLDDYYAWLEQHNEPSIYDGWGNAEPADITGTRGTEPLSQVCERCGSQKVRVTQTNGSISPPRLVCAVCGWEHHEGARHV